MIDSKFTVQYVPITDSHVALSTPYKRPVPVGTRTCIPNAKSSSRTRSTKWKRDRDWKRRMIDKYGQDGFYVHFPLPCTHAHRG